MISNIFLFYKKILVQGIMETHYLTNKNKKRANCPNKCKRE